MAQIGEIDRNGLPSGCLCALGCEVLYGLSYVFTKRVTGTVGALSLLSWLFLVASVVMTICIACRIVKIRLKGKNIKPLLAIALFSPIAYFIGETFGISCTSASESGVFLTCIPAASMLASALLLKKKPIRLQVIGILITLAGALVTVFAVGATSSLSVEGYLFPLMAVVSYALYCVLVEKEADYSSCAEITYVMLVAGSIVFTALALIEAAVAGVIRRFLLLPVRNIDFFSCRAVSGNRVLSSCILPVKCRHFKNRG